jgi:hypothetical protein
MIPSRKVCRMKKSSIVFKINDEAGKMILILNVWSVETPRYPAWLQESGRVTRGMPTSRRSQIQMPKHREVLGRAIRRAPLREVFIPDVKPQGSRAGWQGSKGTPTMEGHASGAPN